MTACANAAHSAVLPAGAPRQIPIYREPCLRVKTFAGIAQSAELPAGAPRNSDMSLRLLYHRLIFFSTQKRSQKGRRKTKTTLNKGGSHHSPRSKVSLNAVTCFENRFMAAPRQWRRQWQRELYSVSDFKGNIGDYGARKSACGIVVIFNKRLAVTNRSFVKAYKFIKSA